MGGGPGMKVPQMAGENPQRRPHNHANQPPQSPLAALQSLLPRQFLLPLLLLIIIIIIPLLSSLFSGAAPTYPSVRFDAAAAPYTQHHESAKLKVDYYVIPKDIANFTPRNLRDLDSHVENHYVQKLGAECEWERNLKKRAFQEAQGFWSRDQVKWQRAEAMAMPACDKLKSWGLTVGY